MKARRNSSYYCLKICLSWNQSLFLSCWTTNVIHKRCNLTSSFSDIGPSDLMTIFTRMMVGAPERRTCSITIAKRGPLLKSAMRKNIASWNGIKFSRIGKGKFSRSSTRMGMRYLLFEIQTWTSCSGSIYCRKYFARIFSALYILVIFIWSSKKYKSQYASINWRV